MAFFLLLKYYAWETWGAAGLKLRDSLLRTAHSTKFHGNYLYYGPQSLFPSRFNRCLAVILLPIVSIGILFKQGGRSNQRTWKVLSLNRRREGKNLQQNYTKCIFRLSEVLIPYLSNYYYTCVTIITYRLTSVIYCLRENEIQLTSLNTILYSS